MTTRPRIEVYPTDNFTRLGTSIFHYRAHGMGRNLFSVDDRFEEAPIPDAEIKITPAQARAVTEALGYEWVELPDPAAKPPDPPVFVATHCVVSKYEKIAIAWGSEADCLAYIGKSSHITVRPFQIGAKP